MMPAAAMRLRTLDAAIFSMFAANEPGVWFDNADLSTLFEDSTGYFPATVNGLVGLQLDKRLGLDQTRRNLLSYTQDFNSTGWLKLGAGASGMVVTDNVALAPDGTMTAASIVEGTGTVQHYIACYGEANSYPIYSGQAYTFSVSVKANGRNFVFLRGHNNTSSIFGSGIIVDLATGAVHHPADPAAGGSATVVVIDEGDGWWRIEMTSTAVSDNLAGSGGPMIAPAASSTFNVSGGTQQQSYTGDGVSGLLVWGAQVDRAAQATEYQPVTVSHGGWIAGNHRYQPATSAKAILRQDSVTGLYRLQYDGVDDFFRADNIDFTGTDTMTVWAGVRKLSDAAVGTVVEASPAYFSNAGSFAIFAPGGAGSAGYAAAVRGTAANSALFGNYAAPNTAVVSATLLTTAANVGAALDVRVNGAVPATETATNNNASSGNFGNHVHYFGRRGGSTLPLNGDEYQMILRGAPTNAHQVAAGAALTAQRTGVALA